MEAWKVWRHAGVYGQVEAWRHEGMEEWRRVGV
jgi:hypothetical protein